jgi:glycosyltransferase involved in cell wall biosynthesis
MKKLPLVSIIVPVYNVEKYLEKCLDSISSQEYSNLEVLLINDGSIDTSRDIAERHAQKDSRFIVVNKKNDGVSSARNKGIELANGKYITFIDADDVIHREFISNLANDLISNDADIVTTNKQYYPITDSKFLSTFVSNDVELWEYSQYEALERLYSGTLEKGHNGVQLFRRDVMINNGLLYDTNMKICEDFDYLARAIAKVSKVIYDPRDMYYYRLNSTGALQTMTAIEHFNSMNNKQLYGRKIVAQHPSIEKFLNNNLCLESISCGVLLMRIKDRYPEEFKQVVSNIASHKYSTLVSQRIDFKNRMKVLILIIFGNTLGLQLINKLTTHLKVSV